MSAPPPRTSHRVVHFLRRHPIGLIVALVLVLILADLARRNDSPQSIGRAVEIDPARLDFGTVWNSDQFVWEAPIRNVTGGTLDVELVPSCGCTSVEPREFSLAPREVQTVTIHLDLRSPTGTRRTGPQERPFTVNLDAFTHDRDLSTSPTQRNRFALAGRVRDALHVRSTVIQFGGAERLVEGYAAQPRTVSVFALTPLNDLRAVSQTPDFETTVARSADVEDEWLLTVTPTDLVPVGQFVGEVRLHPLSDAGQELPSIPVRVQGTKETEFIVTPSHVQFITHSGDASPASDSTTEPITADHETVTLSSRSGRPFLVLVEGLNGDDVIDGQALSITPPASDTALRHEFTLQPVSSGDAPAMREVTFSIYSHDESWTLVLPVFVYDAASAALQVAAK